MPKPKFKKKDIKKQSFWKENKRIIWFAVILCLFSVAITLLQPLFEQLIQNNPSLNENYKFILQQLDEQSFIWLFIIAFIGSLLIFPLAVDFLFAFYILANANPYYTTIACFSGVVLGRIVDYWFGYLFSDIVTKKIIKKHIKQFRKDFSRWGISMIFFGHFIPFFPLEPLSAFLGSIKFDFWKFLAYTCLGKIIKLLLLIMFFKYFFTYGIALMTFSFTDLIKIMFNSLPKPF